MTGSFGSTTGAIPVLDETTTPLRPASVYGASKATLGTALAAQAWRDGVSLAWGRIFMLDGPHERPARLVPDVTQALLDGREVLCGDGRAQRDVLHVADAARALAMLLDSPLQGAVNVASGRCVALRDVIETVAALLGRPGLVRLGARPSRPPSRRAWRPRRKCCRGAWVSGRATDLSKVSRRPLRGGARNGNGRCRHRPDPLSAMTVRRTASATTRATRRDPADPQCGVLGR